MKLTKQRLKQIIVEELRSILVEEPRSYSAYEHKIAKMIMANTGTVEQAKQFVIMSKEGTIPSINIRDVAQIIADELAKLEEPDSWLNALHKEHNTLIQKATEEKAYHNKLFSQNQILATKIRNLRQHIRSAKNVIEAPIIEFQKWLEKESANEGEDFKWIIARGEYRLRRFYNDFAGHFIG